MGQGTFDALTDRVIASFAGPTQLTLKALADFQAATTPDGYLADWVALLAVVGETTKNALRQGLDDAGGGAHPVMILTTPDGRSLDDHADSPIVIAKRALVAAVNGDIEDLVHHAGWFYVRAATATREGADHDGDRYAMAFSEVLHRVVLDARAVIQGAPQMVSADRGCGSCPPCRAAANAQAAITAARDADWSELLRETPPPSAPPAQT